MKTILLLLASMGTIIPYYFFTPFLINNGLDIMSIAELLFVNRVSAFFAADFLISCIVFLTFLYTETKKYKIKQWWICILATITVGLSLAFPLFLYFRLLALEKQQVKSNQVLD
ncbi:DUF2834 domain-containing protein [Bacillus mangrovi]|uniref:DUF2834 domain-containing protein n=1 Tax=Metabacillus mangrovi TaxID=1491830 RepID=A0A7X2V5I2_9BACI|nr:DUF2834 domain-containing protein [Metabacillus mangrovi]MTH54837.1 DUF2834 domain-containing protein [Metabacillus mangrovi]